MKMARIATS